MKECTRRPAWQRYAVAVVMVVAMAAFRWILQPFVSTSSPLITFYFAVIAAAWWGGWRPALVAIALSVIFADVLFFGRPWHLNAFETEHWLITTIFISVGLLVSAMMEELHAARRRALAQTRDIQEKNQRLETEMARREHAEEQLEHIVEGLRDLAVIAMDTEGRIVRWNSGASRIIGYTEAEVLGQSGSLIFTPEDRKKGVPETEFRKARECGSAADERWHLRKDGTLFFGSGSVSLIRNSAGIITGFTKVVRDATDQWRAHKALRESEESFRAVFETAAAGVVQLDPWTGGFQRVNRCFCTITGYEEEELKKLTFSDLTHPQERASDFEAFQKMVRGEAEDYVRDKRYVRKDGRVIWVHVNGGLARNEAGEPRYAVGVVQDITTRRNAELALTAAEERFRLVAEISELGTWTTNPETDESTWSPRLREIFGFPVDKKLTTEATWQAVHPEDRSELERAVNAAKDPAGPGSFISEHRIIRTDGTVRWVQVRGLYLFSGEGAARRPVRGVGAIQDITNRKEAIERLHRRASAVVALATTRPDNLKERIQQVTEAAAGALDIERVSVWLYTPDRSGIRCMDLYVRGTGKHGADLFLAAAQYPNYFQALARGAPILADDACTHDATSEFRDNYLAPLGISSMLDVPIWLGGRLAGVVCHEHTGPARKWSADDQEFAASLATTVALALEADQRRRAEEALAARERQLRQVGDNLPAGVLFQAEVIPDGGFRFLYFSAGLEEETGVTPEEAIADANTLWGVLPPDALQGLQEAQARAVQDLAPIALVLPFKHRRTGEIHWVQLRASPEKGPNGEVIFNGVALDVTVQRQTEEALGEAEERLRLAAKAGGIGTFDRNFETRENHWSPEMNAIFGLPRGSVVPFEKMPSLVHPEDRERVAREIEEVLDPRSLGNFESVHRVLRPDGSVRWVRVSGQTVFSSDKGRRVLRVLGAALDITALKEAEEVAQENSERFRTLADNISQLAWMADEKSGIFWYNRRWIDYTGEDLAKMRGWGWLKLVDPENAARVGEKFRHHLATGDAWEDTYPLRGKDGCYRWFLSRAVPIRDELGRVLRWFGTNTDVTEQRLSEEQLRDADRRKSEFLAMLGHELRNPLAAIRNALVLSQEEHESFDWARGVLERQSAQLARLVDDLLDVSRIARGKVTLRRERVEVCTVVSRAVEAARPLIVQRSHKLFVECPSRELWADADPGRLEQIIGNLLTNAAKYTEPGGEIWVIASLACPVPHKDGNVADLESDKGRQEIAITVRDTGVGIPPHKLPQMFEIFTQAERSLDRAEGGLGLGLAIVKMLTEMHGGRVTAWSAGLGKGSTFAIHLPVAGTPVQSRPEKDSGVDQSTARRIPAAETLPPALLLEPAKGVYKVQRILVVDDNEDAAHALGRLLRRSGCELEIALDGPTALVRAHEFHPTAVLLDIGLPGMDGYEVARRLRAEENGTHTLLIAITGYGQEEDRRRSLEAGFDCHLVKPVDIGELKRILGNGFSELQSAK